jgi:hypothetical protein
MGGRKPDLISIYAEMLRNVRLPGLGVFPEFSVESEKVKLGIDELIFHLAATAGRPVSKREIRSEIDHAIVQALEGLRE